MVLSRSEPKNLNVYSVPTVKQLGIKAVIYFGKYEIPMDEFLNAARYVLTNTDLENKNGLADPRLMFVKNVKKLRIVDGYNKKRKPSAKRLSDGLPSLWFPF